MKNSLIFLGISILIFSCKRSEDKSMFLFFPESKSELNENGYDLNKDFSFYYKRVQDTMEWITNITSNMKIFSKRFQIKLQHQNQDSAIADMNRIADFIKIKSTEVIAEDDHWKLVKIGEFHFFLFYGLSGLKTFCLVNYNNLNNKNQRDASINYLETNLIDNSDSISVKKISNSINFIKAFR